MGYIVFKVYSIGGILEYWKDFRGFLYVVRAQTEYFVLNTSFTRHSKTGQCHFNSS